MGTQDELNDIGEQRLDEAEFEILRSAQSLVALRRQNYARALEWHQGSLDGWSPAEWGNALAGECGELCNVLKKLLRCDQNLQQAKAESDYDTFEAEQLRDKLVAAAAQEIGDTLLYLDLVAARLGLDLWTCARDTFNRVSEREGFEHRL